MMSNGYTPTITELASTWVRAQVERENEHGRIVTVADMKAFRAEVERWLMRVKFDAWEEGYQQDIDDQYAHAAGDYVAYDANPYRAEEED